MSVERYNEYGEIIQELPENKTYKRLSQDQEHRIHQTKDTFDSDCSYCVADMKRYIRTYWSDEDA